MLVLGLALVQLAPPCNYHCCCAAASAAQWLTPAGGPSSYTALERGLLEHEITAELLVEVSSSSNNNKQPQRLSRCGIFR